jgi:hypothetical protein
MRALKVAVLTFGAVLSISFAGPADARSKETGAKISTVSSYEMRSQDGLGIHCHGTCTHGGTHDWKCPILQDASSFCALNCNARPPEKIEGCGVK